MRPMRACVSKLHALHCTATSCTCAITKLNCDPYSYFRFVAVSFSLIACSCVLRSMTCLPAAISCEHLPSFTSSSFRLISAASRSFSSCSSLFRRWYSSFIYAANLIECFVLNENSMTTNATNYIKQTRWGVTELTVCHTTRPLHTASTGHTLF